MTTTLAVDTSRFGTVEYAPEDVITFADGILGFPACREYLVINHGDNSPFRWLQSIEEPALAFLVADPGDLVAGYSPEMPKRDAKALGLTEETARLVYTIVTIPPGKPEEIAVNLAGPIVVNAETRTARQVVIESDEYPTRYRLRGDERSTERAA